MHWLRAPQTRALEASCATSGPTATGPASFRSSASSAGDFGGEAAVAPGAATTGVGATGLEPGPSAKTQEAGAEDLRPERRPAPAGRCAQGRQRHLTCRLVARSRLRGLLHLGCDGSRCGRSTSREAQAQGRHEPHGEHIADPRLKRARRVDGSDAALARRRGRRRGDLTRLGNGAHGEGPFALAGDIGRDACRTSSARRRPQTPCSRCTRSGAPAGR